MSVRVRFAPSPTGSLHLGNALTAVANRRFVDAHGGVLVLRIDDTDSTRTVAGGEDAILSDLAWLDIEFDEGPVRQSARGEVYSTAAARALEGGGAERDDDGSVRLVRTGTTLLRGDGSATYQLASVVDDLDLQITHVIRGSDHRPNVEIQQRIARALGGELPEVIHHGLVLGADGKKLSKRHGAVSVDEFRTAGYVPEALMNFLALLGWAPDGETTIMSRDELVARFTLERVGSSPATFDYAKLDWMNGVYLRDLAVDDYAARLVVYLSEQGLDWPADRVRAAAPLVQEKIGRFGEFPEFAGFLFQDVDPDTTLLDVRILAATADALEGIEQWEAGEIEAALKQLCDDLGEKPRTVYLPIRVAVTGSRVSPGLYESLELLGKESSLARIRAGGEAAA